MDYREWLKALRLSASIAKRYNEFNLIPEVLMLDAWEKKYDPTFLDFIGYLQGEPVRQTGLDQKQQSTS